MSTSLQLGTAHLDILALPHRADEVVAAIAAWARGTRPRSFHVRAVVPRLPARHALPSCRSTPDRRVLVGELAGDPDAWIATRPGGLAKRVQRARTTLERRGITYALATGSDVVACSDHFLRFHEASFGHASTLTPVAATARRAITSGAAAGEVVAHTLVDGGTVVAIELCFEVAGRLTFWHGSRRADVDGAGNVLMWEAVRRGFALGLSELDIGYDPPLTSASGGTWRSGPSGSRRGQAPWPRRRKRSAARRTGSSEGSATAGHTPAEAAEHDGSRPDGDRGAHLPRPA